MPTESAPSLRFDLTPGLPDFTTFPRSAWSRAIHDTITHMRRADLDYQAGGGHPRLRHVLTEYLGRVRGAVVHEDDVTITSGILDGLSLLLRALVAADRTRVAIEDPCWRRLVAAVQRPGLEVVPIEVDAEGMQTGDLSEVAVDAAIVAPAHQFPTGMVLTPERRMLLLEWARASDGLVLEDDYDAEFRYDRRPVGVLQGIDPARVALFGSLSKTLAPGVGIGWVVTPPRWTEAMRSVEARLTGPSTVDQLALASFIETGAYDRHLRALRRRGRAARADGPSSRRDRRRARQRAGRTWDSRPRPARMQRGAAPPARGRPPEGGHRLRLRQPAGRAGRSGGRRDGGGDPLAAGLEERLAEKTPGLKNAW